MKTSPTILAPPQIGTLPSAAAESLAARLGLKSACGRSASRDRLPTVVLSDKALSALRRFDLPADAFVRIGVVAGGCSGQTYSAAVDMEPKAADLTLLESGPLRIVTDPQSAVHLDGLRIDYSDDLIRSGFRFSNPKAGGSCGCGASFKANL